jgi:hypothetical protein
MNVTPSGGENAYTIGVWVIHGGSCYSLEFVSMTPETRDASSAVADQTIASFHSPSASPTATAPAVRLVYRTYDGSQYGLVAEGADGSDRIALAGPNFAHPDQIRFAESRDRRWAAWVDGGELRLAASANLGSATTLVTTTKTLVALAVSNDGATVVYEIRTTNDPRTSAAELYVVHVHDRSVKLLRTFAGPFITCIGDAAFDATAQRLIAVGCGSGQAAGLLLLSTVDGSIISEDDKFSAWPGQWAFASDLKTVWLIVDGSTESDVVRYDTATRSRDVLYRSPIWKQSDGSAAPNLNGPVLLAPDGTGVVFSRYTQDRAPEVYELPSAGGTATMIFKSTTFVSLESWAPGGGYVAISVDNSTPTQRMRLVDPRTKAISVVNTGAGYIGFLAWMVP